jgi:hypothetical protein
MANGVRVGESASKRLWTDPVKDEEEILYRSEENECGRVETGTSNNVAVVKNRPTIVNICSLN